VDAHEVSRFVQAPEVQTVPVDDRVALQNEPQRLDVMNAEVVERFQRAIAAGGAPGGGPGIFG